MQWKFIDIRHSMASTEMIFGPLTLPIHCGIVKNGVLGMTIIPHTYQNTALRERRTGDRVNLEVDILAKYLEKLTHGYKN